MSALTVSDVSTWGGEGCVPDLRIGEALGFDRPRAVRQLIERNREELLTYGQLVQREARAEVGKGATRAVSEFWLNEAQALLICMFARTATAAEVRRQVVTVFLAWRSGSLPPSPAPARPLNDRPDQWQSMSHRLAHAQVAMDYDGVSRPDEYVRSVSRLPIWTAGHRPRWWHDYDVRVCMILTHREMTIDRALAALIERFGEDRSPGRSSIGRFWKRLDRLNGRGH
jgi:hypothetical protein